MLNLPEGIHDYLLGATEPEDELLNELATATTHQTKWIQMQTGHIEGAFLRLLVTAISARNVVEVGTFTGYSALSMAMGLPSDGKIITLDIEPEYTDIARSFWARSPHGAKIELIMGPALETLDTLDGPFDFAFIDADKQNYLNYWEAVLPKMRTGGLIAVDNVLWYGRVLSPKHGDDHAIVEFNEFVAGDERVDRVMLSVRDGITLARKR
jgi:caffeoyl-CoA O-methyltransferase